MNAALRALFTDLDDFLADDFLADDLTLDVRFADDLADIGALILILVVSLNAWLVLIE